MLQRISSLTSMSAMDLSSPSLSAQTSLFSEATTSAAAVDSLDSGLYRTTAKFALCLGVVELLASKGVVPDVLLGTDFGIYISAHLLGIVTLRDAMRLAIIRSHDGPSEKLRNAWYALRMSQTNGLRYISAKTGEMIDKEDLESVDFWLWEDGLAELDEGAGAGASEQATTRPREICETIGELFAPKSVFVNIGNRQLIDQNMTNFVCGRDVLPVIPLMQFQPRVADELGTCTLSIERMLQICGPGHAIRPIRFTRNVYPLPVWEPSKTSDKRTRTEALNMLLNSETSRTGTGVMSSAPGGAIEAAAAGGEPVVGRRAMDEDSDHGLGAAAPGDGGALPAAVVEEGIDEVSVEPVSEPPSPSRRPQGAGRSPTSTTRRGIFRRRSDTSAEEDEEDRRSVASTGSSVSQQGTPTRSIGKRLRKTVGKSLSKVQKSLSGAFGGRPQTDAEDDDDGGEEPETR